MKRRIKPKTLLLSADSNRTVTRMKTALAFHGLRGDLNDYQLESRVRDLLRTLKAMS